MQTHADIIRRAGGPSAVSERIGIPGRVHTVRSWAQRNSIPGERWKSFADAGIATLEELAQAAAAERPDAEAIDGGDDAGLAA